MKTKRVLKRVLLQSILILAVSFEAVDARRGHGGHRSSHSSSHSSSHRSSHSSSHSSSHGSKHSSDHSSGHSSDHSSGHSLSHNLGHSSAHNDFSPSHSPSSSHFSHTSPSSFSDHDLPAHGYNGRSTQPKSHSDFYLSNRPSVFSFLSDPSHHQALTAGTNNHPGVPAGGTFHSTVLTLPTGAVYYAQPPVYSSKPSYHTNPVLEVLNRASYNTVHTTSRHHWSSSDNDDKIIVINNGSPKEKELQTNEIPTAATEVKVEAIQPAESVPEWAASTDTTGATTAAIPGQAPQYGIICVPLNVSKPDPNDNSKTIEVEQIACYPAPPPPEPTTTVEPKTVKSTGSLDSISESNRETVGSFKKTLCDDYSDNSENQIIDSLCKSLNEWYKL